MTIERPTESAYASAAPEIRDMIDQVVDDLRAKPDWRERPPILLEFIDALDLAINGDEAEDGDEEDARLEDEDLEDEDLEDEDEEEGQHSVAAGDFNGVEFAGVDEDEDEADEDAAEDEEDGEPDFAEVMTFYVGAVLERLDERAITAPEQAGFYLLSCHPEHLEAANAWLDQPGNQARFDAFTEANPDYDAVLELVEELYSDLSEDE